MPSLCATKSKTQKHKENQGKNTMNKKKGNGRNYSQVKENRLTDYCRLWITTDNKRVIKETVEVAALARISAEKEGNLVNNIFPFSGKKKKKFFNISFVCSANETRFTFTACRKTKVGRIFSKLRACSFRFFFHSQFMLNPKASWQDGQWIIPRNQSRNCFFWFRF